jgi:heme-degrading monooxygenase HmoA
MPNIGMRTLLAGLGRGVGMTAAIRHVALVELASRGESMIARVVTTDVSPGRMESVIRVADEQLPDARRQPGFTGFYLLADREAGKLMTISLWDSREDVLALEARAAELTSQTVRSGGMAVPDVTFFEVVVKA